MGPPSMSRSSSSKYPLPCAWQSGERANSIPRRSLSPQQQRDASVVAARSQSPVRDYSFSPAERVLRSYDRLLRPLSPDRISTGFSSPQRPQEKISNRSCSPGKRSPESKASRPSTCSTKASTTSSRSTSFGLERLNAVLANSACDDD